MVGGWGWLKMIELGRQNLEQWNSWQKNESAKAVFCLPPRLQEPLRALDSQKRGPNVSPTTGQKYRQL